MKLTDDHLLVGAGVAVAAAIAYVLHTRNTKQTPVQPPMAPSTIVAAPNGESLLDAYGDLEPALSQMRNAIAQATRPAPNPVLSTKRGINPVTDPTTGRTVFY